MRVPWWLGMALGLVCVGEWLYDRWRPAPPKTPLLVRCRNADAVIEGSIRRLAASGRYDPILVQDEGSVDQTPQILRLLSRDGRVVWLDEGPPGPTGLPTLEIGPPGVD